MSKNEKTFKIVGNDISDGYHTFDELYEQRTALFLYALNMEAFKDVELVCDHYPGWDVIRATTEAGEQISFHVAAKYREYYQFNHCRGTVPFDGHTSKDVIERLLKAAWK